MSRLLFGACSSTLAVELSSAAGQKASHGTADPPGCMVLLPRVPQSFAAGRCPAPVLVLHPPPRPTPTQPPCAIRRTCCAASAGCRLAPWQRPLTARPGRRRCGRQSRWRRCEACWARCGAGAWALVPDAAPPLPPPLPSLPVVPGCGTWFASCLCLHAWARRALLQKGAWCCAPLPLRSWSRPSSQPTCTRCLCGSRRWSAAPGCPPVRRAAALACAAC